MNQKAVANWRRSLPFLWLAFSAGCAVVIFVTDSPAWPLALWVATTLGSLSALEGSTKTSIGNVTHPRAVQQYNAIQNSQLAKYSK